MSKEKKLLLFSSFFMLGYAFSQIFYTYFFSKKLLIFNTVCFILSIVCSIVLIYLVLKKEDLSRYQYVIFFISIIFFIINIISGVLGFLAFKDISKKEKRELPSIKIMKNYKWYIYLLVLIIYSILLFTKVCDFLIKEKYQMYLYYLFIFIFLCLIFRRDLKRDIKLFFNYFKEYNVLIFKYYGISLLILIVLSFLLKKVTGIDTATNQVTLNEMFKTSPVFISCLAIIYAPITEEIVFRGIFRKFINNKWLFIIISGLVFGLMHVIDDFKSVSELLFILVYADLGCFLAALYYKTNNIITNIYFHFIQNTLAVLAMILIKFI